ncbi:MAG: hypothetical protein KDK12_19955 [Rhodobacteraceae bacterium]|nr:hypothetical protein [Paracoccaceae bacterium]
MTSALSVVILAALVLSAVAFLVVSLRTERKRRAGYLAMAERRAWDYEFVRARGNRPAEVRFADPVSGIALVVTRRLSRKSGSTTTTRGGATVAHLREPRLAGGLAVYTPPLDKDLASAATTMLGILDNSVGRFLVGRLLGEEFSQHVGQLVEQPVPAGADVSILASVDPRPVVDARAMARALSVFPGDKAMAMVSDEGIRLRIGRALAEPEEIERLFDTALALGRDLREGSPQRLSS